MRLFEIEKFFGRKPIRDLLKKRVLDLKDGYRQNMAFLGGQHSGKSILIQKFISDLDDPDIIPIYIDLENIDFHFFFNKFAGSLLYYYAISRGLAVYEDLSLLIESTQKFLPKTTKAIKKIQPLFATSKNLETYQEILSLTDVFIQETGRFCILILDEFQGLEDFSIPNVFQELGKKIMTQKKCLYLVASSYPQMAQQILSEKFSLLFGDFEVIRVEAFDIRTSLEFLAFHLNGLKMSDSLQKFLIDFTGGQPLYLKLICQELMHQSVIHKQTEIYIPLVVEAVENVLFNPWGVLSRHFDFYIVRICSGKGNWITARILIMLSLGKQRLREVVQKISFKQNQASQRLSRLVEMDIIAKNGQSFYIKDKLFKYWIRFVYQKRYQSITMDSDHLRHQLREELLTAWENFKRQQRRDLPDRIIELLSCFEEESLQINGRRYKLPLFREIVQLKFKKECGDFFHVITAVSAAGPWLIFPTKGAIGDNDMNSLVDLVKKSEQKPQRCILISLTDMDENVRVRALQERMWIWNEGELNALLDFFDKPYIV